MYICARGRLQVVDTDGKTVLATLKAGSYFGEISILNMGTAGNRRTASVCSVGYSDLFVLSKKDMWDVLKDYPAARVRLEAVAAKKIERYKKVPLEKGKLVVLGSEAPDWLMFSCPGQEPVHPRPPGDRGQDHPPRDVGLSSPTANQKSRLHRLQVVKPSIS